MDRDADYRLYGLRPVGAHGRLVTMNALALALAVALVCSAATAAVAQPIFHGTLHDCDGDDFSGHLPKGFVCRGAGTGVGICLKPGDRRVISYDVQGGPDLPPSGYCHLDWVAVNASQLQQDRRYMKCK